MLAREYRPLSLCARHVIINTIRLTHWKFERTFVPPLQEPRESPYIVGPYLKPGYVPTKYITDPIQPRVDNDLDHFMYKPRKVEYDESRTVKLLLIDDVEGLGVAGQVVDTPFRFGASRLVAMKKADYATEFAFKWYKFGPRTAQSASSALSPRTARFLKSQTFVLPISHNVEVKTWHLSLALRFGGCICPKEAIDEESIKKITDQDGNPLVQCTVRINNHERVEVKFVYGKLSVG